LIIKFLGVEGAVIGMIVTSMIVNFCNWRAYRHELLGPAAPAAPEPRLVSRSASSRCHGPPATAAVGRRRWRRGACNVNAQQLEHPALLPSWS
jgi:hypothetical protein